MAKGAGYTVGELIEELRSFPPHAPLGIADGSTGEMQVLSIYQTQAGVAGDRVGRRETVWIDVQARESV